MYVCMYVRIQLVVTGLANVWWFCLVELVFFGLEVAVFSFAS